jgi:hypothetical protein
VKTLKLDDNQFYVLDAGTEKWIFTTRPEAISQMKEVVKNGNGESVKLLCINTEEDSWVIEQYPWKDIAFELIKEHG